MIEDCVFGGLKLGSKSSVDQVFEWVVHVLWRCEYFFSGWYGSNILEVWNGNRRRLDASIGRGGYRFIDVGIRIVSEYISGSIGRRIGHGWLIALLLCVLCCSFFLEPVDLSDS